MNKCNFSSDSKGSIEPVYSIDHDEFLLLKNGVPLGQLVSIDTESGIKIGPRKYKVKYMPIEPLEIELDEYQV